MKLRGVSEDGLRRLASLTKRSDDESIVGRTLDDVLEWKTLEQWCKFFGWQGGTLHQVRRELKDYLGSKGIVEDKNGILSQMVFD